MSGDHPGGAGPGAGDDEPTGRSDGRPGRGEDAPRRFSRRRGFLTGVAMALVSTGVAYALMWPSAFSARFGEVLFAAFWGGPVLAAIVLALFDRTRSLAGGFIGGLMLTWVVSVPTCVAVTLNTVPDLFG